MKLSAFLKQYVDGYLFSDLLAMESAKPTTPTHGHLGYPMLMSCAAGIELLGILVGPKPFITKPRDNFLRYWGEYLYLEPPRRDVGDAVYQLVRHGIAHNCAVKVAIDVTKAGANHLTTRKGVTTIDAISLFHELLESYRNRFLPVADGLRIAPSGADAASMQNRLDELGAAFARDYSSHGGILSTLPQPSLRSDVPATPSGGLPGIITTPAVSSSFTP